MENIKEFFKSNKDFFGYMLIHGYNEERMGALAMIKAFLTINGFKGIRKSDMHFKHIKFPLQLNYQFAVKNLNTEDVRMEVECELLENNIKVWTGGSSEFYKIANVVLTKLDKYTTRKE